MLFALLMLATGLVAGDAIRTARVEPVPTDPLYQQQWHLPVIKAAQAWQTTRGEGVVVQIIDDGVQITHPELSEQYVPSLSHNFNSGDSSDPSPDVKADFHGTACAGVATGRNNSVCGVGSAYRARLAGIRLIGEQTDDAMESEGLTFGMDQVDVMSCSWGPQDDGKRLEGPGSVTKRAFENAAVSGRKGKGSIWVWAGGNGGAADDNCNYDGYANHPLTIAIGAVGDNGVRSYYSEMCAALLVAAPSSGGQRGITTCDLMGSAGYSATDCYDRFGGTSSAAPLVAGVVALMLGANKNLGWKDVQYILMTTASRVDPNDPDWVKNGAGRWVNHKYGYGLIDANAAVLQSAAYNTPLSVAPRRISLPKQTVNKAIPQYPGGPVIATFRVENVTALCEAVQIFFTSSHPEATELSVALISPMGTRSELAALRAISRDVVLGSTMPSVTTNFYATLATFGSMPIDAAVTGAAVVVPGFACQPVNMSLAGQFAIVSRGECTFAEKAVNLARAGAIGVVIYNNEYGNPIAMQGIENTVQIPVLMVSKSTYEALRFPLQMSVIVRQSKESVPLKYQEWGFTTMRLWGENANGVWQLVVEDKFRGSETSSQGSFVDWRIVVWNNDVTVTAPPSGGDLDVDLVVVAGVFAAMVFVAAGAVALYMFVKRKGPFARWRGRSGDHGVIMTSSGLAMEEDFDFGADANEAEADDLFLTTTSDGE